MLRLPVRALAEFVHRRGDLHARLDGRTRADEGIQAQRKLQQGRGDAYQRERAVKLETTLAGVPVTVSGRIDGCELDGAVIVVEEFKTTRADPQLAHAHAAAVHWAQALLYAGLLVRELDDSREVQLRLLYCHPDTLATQIFERRETALAATQFLDATLHDYAAWLEGQQAHERQRDARLQCLTFPFPSFRPFQRAVARRVFRALRDREHLLLEAPTGSGKTAATLFPAVRALQASGYRRVILLTSRTTGALAARDAAIRMDSNAEYLRHIVLTAKDKACFLPGTPCEPDACPYARGYYDRARAAAVDLLAHRAIGPETVAAVAQAHQVCPFELSLDASVWCDVVVGDYNYVFDPVVRLQRFAGDAEAALLVDEAHQLAPRVRDMLSLTITRREVKEALAEAPPDALTRPLRSLDRALGAVRRGLAADPPAGQEVAIERPEKLLRAMQRCLDALAAGDYPLEPLPATRTLLFNCSRWARSEVWYHPERFIHLAQAAGRGVLVRLACLDPGPYIRDRLAEYGGHVRFSGTVSPLALYARLHGEPEAPTERAGNPFSAEQLQLLLVDDVPTYLRQRQHSLDRLVALLAAVIEARAGHYLVAFPSFEYLSLAADVFEAQFPEHAVVRQTPAMGEAARAEFLGLFAAQAVPRLGFVVLGGAFGESVDFSAARLAGIVCVGVGLPPPSATGRALQRHFDLQGVDGKAVAYHQPAMVKVLQMAGRLLRSPDDRGVLCLVDARFRAPEYQQFFPDHWQPRVVKAQQVSAALANFWQVP
ncbi:MAG: ATP-dependent DNA helicase [Pseudomonadales bacterium]